LLEAGGEQRCLKLDVECAAGLVRRIGEMGEWRGVAGRPRHLRHAKRCKRLRRDHPGRNGGEETLAEERAEGLRFPPLDVARRPVVEQAKARDVVCGLRYRDWLAQ